MIVGISKRDKRRARDTLNNAIKAGKLERPATCDVCGERGPVEAHHTDHAAALRVRWLCKRCHVSVEQAEASYAMELLGLSTDDNRTALQRSQEVFRL